VLEHERREFVEFLRAELPGLAWAPVHFLSARDGEGVQRAVDLAEELFEESRRRVGTGELNRVLQKALESRAPASSGARRKVLYATQTDGAPPTFVLFVNDRRLFTKSVVRYLENRLRAEHDFRRVPLRLVLRDRRSQEKNA